MHPLEALPSLALYSSLLAQTVLAESSIPSFDPFSSSSRCPIPCNDDLTQWTQLSSIHKLESCNATLLFRLNLYNEDPGVPVQACVPSSAPEETSTASRMLLKIRQLLPFTSNKRAAADAKEKSKDVQLFTWASGDKKLSSNGITAVATALAGQLQAKSNDGNDSVLFAKQDSTIIGAFVGSELQKQSISDIVDKFAKWTGEHDDATQVAAQICDDDSFASQILGLFMDAGGDFSSVRERLQDWAHAKCVKSDDASPETWKDMSVSVVPSQIMEGKGNGRSNSNSSSVLAATCSTIDAEEGDSCWSLAEKCGITEDEFREYNVDGICDTLQVGQHVCCSEGDMPDFSPQPNPDGSCQTHTIQEGDDCDTIARNNDMTVDQINERNKNVWGWTGCQYLILDSKICLSTGDQPMPSPLQNATCGPQVPGTEKPDDMDDLASLNPCPIKACCNVWGNCGITEDFCIPSPADTGAPGTSKPGENGCIYNCGMDIVNNDTPPDSFMTVGYFEAWNQDRPCLHMRVSDLVLILDRLMTY